MNLFPEPFYRKWLCWSLTIFVCIDGRNFEILSKNGMYRIRCIPIGSMYGILTFTININQMYICIYTIHGRMGYVSLLMGQSHTNFQNWSPKPQKLQAAGVGRKLPDDAEMQECLARKLSFEGGRRFSLLQTASCFFCFLPPLGLMGKFYHP